MRSAFVLILLSALSAAGAAAQDPDPLRQASALLTSGDLARADAEYSAYLELHPEDREARLGRAAARAWSGLYDLALDDYALILERAPSDIEALSGSGYAHLWAGRFEEGEQYFDALLQSRSSLEALKGLAYAALWSGRHSLAVARFERLVEEYPGHSDAYAGLAEALMASSRPEGARLAARQAEALAPGRTDLRWVEREARRAPAPFEVSVTAGSTVFDAASGDSPLAVRSIDIAYRPSTSLTLMAQYDDGISVDTRALAIAGQGVPTYRIASAAAWGGRFITRTGAGARSLAGNLRQNLLDLDQAIVLGSVGIAAGWTGLFGSGQPYEQAMRLGMTLVPNPAWEIGATGHLRMVDGIDGRTVVLAVTRKLHAPVAATSGAALGRSAATGLATREIFAQVSARPWGGNGLTLAIRRRFGAGTDPFTAVAAGMTIGAGRR